MSTSEINKIEILTTEPPRNVGMEINSTDSMADNPIASSLITPELYAVDSVIHSDQPYAEDNPIQTVVHPNYNVQYRLATQERLIFGVPASGVFGEVKPTRSNQLRGVLNIITSINPHNSTAKEFGSKEITSITKGHSVASERVTSIGQSPVQAIERGGVFGDILGNLEKANDPLHQTLSAIESHKPPLDADQYPRLVIDSLTLLLRDQVNAALREARKDLKKSQA